MMCSTCLFTCQAIQSEGNGSMKSRGKCSIVAYVELCTI